MQDTRTINEYIEEFDRLANPNDLRKLKINGYPNLYMGCEFPFEIRYPYKPYIL